MALGVHPYLLATPRVMGPRLAARGCNYLSDCAIAINFIWNLGRVMHV